MKPHHLRCPQIDYSTVAALCEVLQDAEITHNMLLKNVLSFP